MAVKGSKLTPMRVVPHNSLVTTIRYAAVLLSLPAAYLLGTYVEGQSQLSAADNKAQQVQRKVSSLTQDLTVLRTNAEVDRQTIEELRQLVMTQKAQLTASERDLRVYKELLSPGAKSNPLGISVGVFTVSPLKEAGHFNYSLTVQKLSARESDFTGDLDIIINGQQVSKSVQLTLDQVSSPSVGPTLPLNFKYFQTIEGELTLPADFTPQSVAVAVRAGDRKNPPLVETQLDWPASANKPK